MPPMPSGPAATTPLRPRTVLVTGAARRLGREIALTLARRGWNVAIHYRHSAEDATQTVADCTTESSANGIPDASFGAFAADLAQEESVRQLWADVLARFGHVDAVVNSASTFEHDAATSFSYAALDKHLHANTAAAIVLAQCLHAHRLAAAQQPPDGQWPDHARFGRQCGQPDVGLARRGADGGPVRRMGGVEPRGPRLIARREFATRRGDWRGVGGAGGRADPR